MRGRLISASFAETALHTLPGAGAPPSQVARAIEAWAERRETTLGPASSVRAIVDVAIIPLLTLLGFVVHRRMDSRARALLDACRSPGVVVPVLVVPWAEPLDSAWRAVTLDSVRADARWGMCSNGVSLRIIDVHRTWSRDYVEFDLALLAHTVPALTALWSVARADAMACDPPVLDRATLLSERHGARVCEALGDGVLGGLERLYATLSPSAARCPAATVLDHALTVLYRILFLLFAEAGRLVPMWHPVYRERYTIDAIVETLLAGRRYRGIWRAVLAISRLAHAGCTAGTLKVTAFNGRLFAPAGSATFDRTPISDAVMTDTILALGTARGSPAGRTRIAYGDLDVEQLGAVYERVLEYEPSADGARTLTRTRDVRQSSGTFYTPRQVTSFLVRQTLEPLVRGRSASEVLRLRILDPAMGSGAFLVGACRYLASVVEERLVQEGRWHPGNVSAEDRAAVRREVAQRCLFGVDLNPMAVQLARLSLWLATLAADKPLTFLDHHLVCGDSLVGATLEDLLRPSAGGRGRTRRSDTLPLFELSDSAPMLEHAVRTRLRLARDADESAAIVAAKEKALASLTSARSPLGRWSAVLDLWCAGWFWDAGTPPGRAVLRELTDHLVGLDGSLPERTIAPYVDRSALIAGRQRFLHWTLAFPEVFCDERGEKLPDAGFDAILGNPPWDMVRGDSGDGTVRTGRKADARKLLDFVREAGIYQVAGRSQVNRYQLFVERALQLVRPSGRLGMVLPAGIMADAGAAPLRRHLFDRADVDAITGLDNRGGIFPIHRSLRFVLLTGTAGRSTTGPSCRFGVTRAQDLDAPPDGCAPIVITRPLLARLSGDDDLGIPDIRGERDLRIVERISARFPWLMAEDGWHACFGRELNATDDRDAFTPFTGDTAARPVLEGKQIEPFRTSIDACRFELRPAKTTRTVVRRARLAYRDVASATNKLTLIAAIIPARAVTTHTLFCLKTPLPADAQWALCGLLNSFVANYLVRMRVNTHVTVALASRLPVPRVPSGTLDFERLAALARALGAGSALAEEMAEYSELQALVGRLYGLTQEDFIHVLSTFPLIPEQVKERALRAFRSLPEPQGS